MMEMSVVIKPSAMGLAKSFMNLNIVSFLRAEVNRLAASVERYAKQLTPVKTGFLRGSIHFTPVTTFLQTVVSTKRDYAIYVHEGTKYMRSRPFMKYGAMFAQVGIEKEIGARLDQEFTKAFKTLK